MSTPPLKVGEKKDLASESDKNNESVHLDRVPTQTANVAQGRIAPYASSKNKISGLGSHVPEERVQGPSELQITIELEYVRKWCAAHWMSLHSPVLAFGPNSDTRRLPRHIDGKPNHG
ncbi:hypothetical protein DFH07DRAFT_764750 [Mycena maculata]|uniref:Uncharacterized protein n=1 Tax=Mycena maculata TaxID=230809 RepID=A0AAD7NZR2_9AGAR|nr:hypothetical protein DFH07DRAFT_764750 [Mycena maculata]